MRRRHPDEVSPEEIFNMFFGVPNTGRGGGGPGFRVYTAGGGGGGGGNGHPQGRLAQLGQMLPLLLLFALSFFSYPSGSVSRGLLN